MSGLQNYYKIRVPFVSPTHCLTCLFPDTLYSFCWYRRMGSPFCLVSIGFVSIKESCSMVTLYPAASEILSVVLTAVFTVGRISPVYSVLPAGSGTLSDEAAAACHFRREGNMTATYCPLCHWFLFWASRCFLNFLFYWFCLEFLLWTAIFLLNFFLNYHCCFSSFK